MLQSNLAQPLSNKKLKNNLVLSISPYLEALMPPPRATTPPSSPTPSGGGGTKVIDD